MRQTKGEFSHFLRAFAVCTLICFTTTTVQATPTLSTAYGVRSPEISLTSLEEKISIPSELGIIREVYHEVSPQSSDAVHRTPSAVPVIVHVEEAHGQPEGQENIERILAHLRKAYGLNTVYLEGAWKPLDPANLHFFDDAKLNRQLLEEMNRRGLIGGVELDLADSYGVRSTEYGAKESLARRSPSAGRVYGVEDLKLYKENLEQFRAVYAAKPQTDAALKEIRQKITDEASVAFNLGLKKFFRDWAFHSEVAAEPFAGLEQLPKVAEEHLALDLTNAREQYDWPQLVRFFKLKALEKTAYEVRGTEYGEEKQKLISWILAHRLDPESYHLSDILQDEASGAARRTPSALPRGRDIRSLMEDFYSKAAPLGFRFEDYPNLTRRIGIAILSNELQAPDLFKEVEKLNDQILAKLATSDVEKALIERYKEYRSLKKLFSLELSREEYQELLEQRTTHNAQREKLASPTLTVARCALSFYETAEKREQALFRNMFAQMKSLKQANAVLVTGGFHSEGLAELFKKNGISYVRVAPRITNLESNANYLSVMTGITPPPGAARRAQRATPKPGSDSSRDQDSSVRAPSFALLPDLRKDLGPVIAGHLLGIFQEALRTVGGRNKVPVGELIAPRLAALGLAWNGTQLSFARAENRTANPAVQEEAEENAKSRPSEKKRGIKIDGKVPRAFLYEGQDLEPGDGIILDPERPEWLEVVTVTDEEIIVRPRRSVFYMEANKKSYRREYQRKSHSLHPLDYKALYCPGLFKKLHPSAGRIAIRLDGDKILLTHPLNDAPVTIDSAYALAKFFQSIGILLFGEGSHSGEMLQNYKKNTKIVSVWHAISGPGDMVTDFLSPTMIARALREHNFDVIFETAESEAWWEDFQEKYGKEIHEGHSTLGDSLALFRVTHPVRAEARKESGAEPGARSAGKLLNKFAGQSLVSLGTTTSRSEGRIDLDGELTEEEFRAYFISKSEKYFQEPFARSVFDRIRVGHGNSVNEWPTPVMGAILTELEEACEVHFRRKGIRSIEDITLPADIGVARVQMLNLFLLPGWEEMRGQYREGIEQRMKAFRLYGYTPELTEHGFATLAGNYRKIGERERSLFFSIAALSLILDGHDGTLDAGLIGLLTELLGKLSMDFSLDSRRIPATEELLRFSLETLADMEETLQKVQAEARETGESMRRKILAYYKDKPHDLDPERPEETLINVVRGSRTQSQFVNALWLSVHHTEASLDRAIQLSEGSGGGVNDDVAILFPAYLVKADRLRRAGNMPAALEYLAKAKGFLDSGRFSHFMGVMAGQRQGDEGEALAAEARAEAAWQKTAEMMVFYYERLIEDDFSAETAMEMRRRYQDIRGISGVWFATRIAESYYAEWLLEQGKEAEATEVLTGIFSDLVKNGKTGVKGSSRYGSFSQFFHPGMPFTPFEDPASPESGHYVSRSDAAIVSILVDPYRWPEDPKVLAEMLIYAVRNNPEVIEKVLVAWADLGMEGEFNVDHEPSLKAALSILLQEQGLEIWLAALHFCVQIQDPALNADMMAFLIEQAKEADHRNVMAFVTDSNAVIRALFSGKVRPRSTQAINDWITAFMRQHKRSLKTLVYESFAARLVASGYKPESLLELLQEAVEQETQDKVLHDRLSKRKESTLAASSYLFYFIESISSLSRVMALNPENKASVAFMENILSFLEGLLEGGPAAFEVLFSPAEKKASPEAKDQLLLQVYSYLSEMLFELGAKAASHPLKERFEKVHQALLDRFFVLYFRQLGRRNVGSEDLENAAKKLELDPQEILEAYAHRAEYLFRAQKWEELQKWMVPWIRLLKVVPRLAAGDSSERSGKHSVALRSIAGVNTGLIDILLMSNPELLGVFFPESGEQAPVAPSPESLNLALLARHNPERERFYAAMKPIALSDPSTPDIDSFKAQMINSLFLFANEIRSQEPELAEKALGVAIAYFRETAAASRNPVTEAEFQAGSRASHFSTDKPFARNQQAYFRLCLALAREDNDAVKMALTELHRADEEAGDGATFPAMDTALVEAVFTVQEGGSRKAALDILEKLFIFQENAAAANGTRAPPVYDRIEILLNRFLNLPPAYKETAISLLAELIAEGRAETRIPVDSVDNRFFVLNALMSRVASPEWNMALFRVMDSKWADGSPAERSAWVDVFTEMAPSSVPAIGAVLFCDRILRDDVSKQWQAPVSAFRKELETQLTPQGYYELAEQQFKDAKYAECGQSLETARRNGASGDLALSIQELAAKRKRVAERKRQLQKDLAAQDKDLDSLERSITAILKDNSEDREALDLKEKVQGAREIEAQALEKFAEEDYSGALEKLQEFPESLTGNKTRKRRKALETWIGALSTVRGSLERSELEKAEGQLENSLREMQKNWSQGSPLAEHDTVQHLRDEIQDLRSTLQGLEHAISGNGTYSAVFENAKRLAVFPNRAVRAAQLVLRLAEEAFHSGVAGKATDFKKAYYYAVFVAELEREFPVIADEGRAARNLASHAMAQHWLPELTDQGFLISAMVKARQEREEENIRESNGRPIEIKFSKIELHPEKRMFTVYDLKLGRAGATGGETVWDDLGKPEKFGWPEDTFRIRNPSKKEPMQPFFRLVKRGVEHGRSFMQFELPETHKGFDYLNALLTGEVSKGGILTRTSARALERQEDYLADYVLNLTTSTRLAKGNGLLTTQATTGNALVDYALGLQIGVAAQEKETDFSAFEKMEAEYAESGKALDPAQRAAVKETLRPAGSPGNYGSASPIVLVQGPPGTGKTKVIEWITKLASEGGQRVVVLSQSNAGADNVAKKLLEDGLPFVRVGSNEDAIDHEILPSWEARGPELDLMLKQRKSGGGSLLIGTINGFSGDKEIRTRPELLNTDVLIIDEASLATLPEFFFAFAQLQGVKKIIVVGDPDQLPAFGISDEDRRFITKYLNQAKKLGRNIFAGNELKTRFGQRTLLEILDKEKRNAHKKSYLEKALDLFYPRELALAGFVSFAPYFFLNIQRRSGSWIVRLINYFYRKSGRPKLMAGREITGMVIDDNTHGRFGFHDENANSEDHDGGKKNPGEADRVITHIHWLMNKKHLGAEDIGVISPYADQVELIRDRLLATSKAHDYLVRLAAGQELSNDEWIVFEELFGSEALEARVDYRADSWLMANHPGYRGLRGQQKGGVRREKVRGIKDSLRRIRRGEGDRRTQAAEILRFLGLEGSFPAAYEIEVSLLDVTTVNKSQGSEYKAVIVSWVRSNEDDNVGFLADPVEGRNRINVAISRAKDYLIMVWDRDTFERCKDPDVHEWVMDYNDVMREFSGSGPRDRGRHRRRSETRNTTLPDDQLDWISREGALFKAQREKILKSNTPWEEKSVALADLADHYVAKVAEEFKRYIHRNYPDTPPMLFVATGSYGRREVAPHSDYDGLVVVRTHADVESLKDHFTPGGFVYESSRVLGGAWDLFALEEFENPVTVTDLGLTKEFNAASSASFAARMQATHRTTAPEIQREAMTQLLFAREVSSPGLPFAELETALKNHLDQPVKRARVLRQILDAWDEHRQEEGYFSGLAEREPDLKWGAGGLKDFDVASWVVRLFFRDENDAIDQTSGHNIAFLTREEFEEARKAAAHIREIRWKLQALPTAEEGGSSDRLGLEQQPALAEWMYRETGAGEDARVVLFLEDLHRAQRTLYLYASTILDRALQKTTPLQYDFLPDGDDEKFPFPGVEKAKRFGETITENGPVLIPEDRKEAVLTLHPGQSIRPDDILEIFKFAAEHDCALTGELLDGIKNARAAFLEHLGRDEAFRAQARAAFAAILRAKGPIGDLLLQAHLLGLLEEIVPGYRELNHRVVQDFKYEHTLDVQSINYARILDGLRGKAEVTGPMAGASRLSIPEDWLAPVRAAMLVDALIDQKIPGIDPSKVFALIGLDPAEAGKARWLIEKRTALFSLMQNSGLYYPDEFLEFQRDNLSDAAGRPDFHRWQVLVALTLTQIETFQKGRTEIYLNRLKPFLEITEEEFMDPERMKTYYREHVPLDQLPGFAEGLEDDEVRVDWEATGIPDTWVLRVASRSRLDRPGRLFRIATVLASGKQGQFSVLSLLPQHFAKGAITVNAMIVRRNFLDQALEEDPKFSENLTERFRSALLMEDAGKVRSGYRNKPFFRSPALMPLPPTKVLVRHYGHSNFVYLETPDGIGALADIAHILLMHGLLLGPRSTIDTVGYSRKVGLQIQDTIHVLRPDGSQPSSREMKDLAEDLEFAFSHETITDEVLNEVLVRVDSRHRLRANRSNMRVVDEDSFSKAARAWSKNRPKDKDLGRKQPDPGMEAAYLITQQLPLLQKAFGITIRGDEVVLRPEEIIPNEAGQIEREWLNMGDQRLVEAARQFLHEKGLNEEVLGKGWKEALQTLSEVDERGRPAQGEFRPEFESALLKARLFIDLLYEIGSGILETPIAETAREIIDPDPGKTFDPERVMDLFIRSAETKKPVSAFNQIAIMAAAGTVASDSPEARELWKGFMRFLRVQTDISDAVYAMHQTGLLSLMSPEFAELDNIYDDNAYWHYYRVSNHALYAFDNFEELTFGDLPPNGAPSQVLGAVGFHESAKDPEWLARMRLGVLFHDVGKQLILTKFQVSHQIRGAITLLPQILERAGLLTQFAADEFRTFAFLQFIIWYHQHGNSIIQNFRELIESALFDWQARLAMSAEEGLDPRSLIRAFAAITLADRLGTHPDRNAELMGRAPEAWVNPIILERTREFFLELQAFFESGFNALSREKILRRRDEKNRAYTEELLDQLKRYYPSEAALAEARKQLGKFAALKGYDYLRRFRPDMIQEHLVLFNKLEEMPVDRQGIPLVSVLHSEEGYSRADQHFLHIAVGVPFDEPGILARLTGVFAGFRLSIHDADVTGFDGKTFDHFMVYQVGQEGEEMGVSDDFVAALTKALREIVVEKDYMPKLRALFAAQGRPYEFDTFEDSGGPASLKFLPSEKQGNVRLLVHMPNGLGRMHVVTRVLDELKINIDDVPVETRSFGAEDIFEMKNGDGTPLSEHFQAGIRSAFEELLSLKKIREADILRAIAAAEATRSEMRYKIDYKDLSPDQKKEAKALGVALMPKDGNGKVIGRRSALDGVIRTLRAYEKVLHGGQPLEKGRSKAIVSVREALAGQGLSGKTAEAERRLIEDAIIVVQWVVDQREFQHRSEVEKMISQMASDEESPDMLDDGPPFMELSKEKLRKILASLEILATLERVDASVINKALDRKHGNRPPAEMPSLPDDKTFFLMGIELIQARLLAEQLIERMRREAIEFTLQHCRELVWNGQPIPSDYHVREAITEAGILFEDNEALFRVLGKTIDFVRERGEKRSEVRQAIQPGTIPGNPRAEFREFSGAIRSELRKEDLAGAVIAERPDGLIIADLSKITDEAVLAKVFASLEAIEAKDHGRDGFWMTEKILRETLSYGEPVWAMFDADMKLDGILFFTPWGHEKEGTRETYKKVVLQALVTRPDGPDQDWVFFRDTFFAAMQEKGADSVFFWTRQTPTWKKYFQGRTDKGVILDAQLTPSRFPRDSRLQDSYWVRLEPLDRSESRDGQAQSAAISEADFNPYASSRPEGTLPLVSGVTRLKLALSFATAFVNLPIVLQLHQDSAWLMMNPVFWIQDWWFQIGFTVAGDILLALGAIYMPQIREVLPHKPLQPTRLKPVQVGVARRSENRDKPKQLTSEEIKRLNPEYMFAENFFDQYEDMRQWLAEKPGRKLVTLVSHGRSGSNEFEYHQDHSMFSPLTIFGRLQVAALVAFFKKMKITFEAYLSSDLERDYQTVSPLARRAGKKPEVLESLREVKLDWFGGYPYRWVASTRAKMFRIFRRDPAKYEIEGYSGSQAEKDKALLFLKEIPTRPEKTFLIGVHRLDFLMDLMNMLEIPSSQFDAVYQHFERGNLKNAAMTVLTYDPEDGKWKLWVKTDIDYLPEGRRQSTRNPVVRFFERIFFWFQVLERLVFKALGYRSVAGPLADYWPDSRLWHKPSPGQLDVALDKAEAFIEANNAAKETDASADTVSSGAGADAARSDAEASRAESRIQKINQSATSPGVTANKVPVGELIAPAVTPAVPGDSLRFETRNRLGRLSERVSEKKFTVTAELAAPRLDDPASMKKYLAERDAFMQLYGAGWIDGTSTRSAPEVPAWVEDAALMMRGKKLRKDSFPYPRGFQEFMRRRGEKIENSQDPRAVKIADMWSEVGRFEKIREMPLPGTDFVATVALQTQSAFDVLDIIRDLGNRPQTKALLFMGGGHPLRKTPLAQFLVQTDWAIKEAVKMKKNGEIPANVQIWATWNPHAGDALQDLTRKKKAGATVIYTQPPLFPGEFRKTWDAAQAAGLMDNLQFKIGMTEISSAKNLRFWCHLMGVDPYRDPEAAKSLDAWQRAEAFKVKQPEAFGKFRDSYNRGRFEKALLLPGVTGIHLFPMSHWKNVEQYLANAGFSPAGRVEKDKGSRAESRIQKINQSATSPGVTANKVPVGELIASTATRAAPGDSPERAEMREPADGQQDPNILATFVMDRGTSGTGSWAKKSEGLRPITGSRIFDVLAGLSLAILFSPVILIISGLIWLFSGSPVILKQQRVGYRGKLFMVYKLRTLEKNKEEITLPFGSFSIPFGAILRRSGLDELPQLFNIIEGSMTFFGPRPLLKGETTRQHLDAILAFRKPGLFSYFKAQFPLGASTQKGFLASSYVRPSIAYNHYERVHWSVAFQIKILFLTVWNVCRGFWLMARGVREDLPLAEELLKRIGIFPEVKNVLKTERSEASPAQPIAVPAAPGDSPGRAETRLPRGNMKLRLAESPTTPQKQWQRVYDAMAPGQNSVVPDDYDQFLKLNLWGPLFRELPPGAKVVGLASGRAVPETWARKIVQGAQVYAVDFIDPFRDDPESKPQGVTFIQADMEQASKAAGIPHDADLVMSLFGVEYGDVIKVLRETADILKEGGLFCFFMHHPYSAIINSAREDLEAIKKARETGVTRIADWAPVPDREEILERLETLRKRIEPIVESVRRTRDGNDNDAAGFFDQYLRAIDALLAGVRRPDYRPDEDLKLLLGALPATLDDQERFLQERVRVAEKMDPEYLRELVLTARDLGFQITEKDVSGAKMNGSVMGLYFRGRLIRKAAPPQAVPAKSYDPQRDWQSLYDVMPSGEHSPVWPELERALMKSVWEPLFRKLPSDAKVVGLASGRGKAEAGVLAITPGAQVHAVDYVDPFRNTPGSKPKGVTFVQAAMERASEAPGVPKDAADLVMSQYGVEYGDVPAVLRQAAIILKEGGRFCFFMHHPGSAITQATKYELEMLGPLDEAGLGRIADWDPVPTRPQIIQRLEVVEGKIQSAITDVRKFVGTEDNVTLEFFKQLLNAIQALITIARGGDGEIPLDRLKGLLLLQAMVFKNHEEMLRERVAVSEKLTPEYVSRLAATARSLGFKIPEPDVAYSGETILGWRFVGELVKKPASPDGAATKQDESSRRQALAAAVSKWQNILRGMTNEIWFDKGGYASFELMAEEIAPIEAMRPFTDADDFYERIFLNSNIFKDALDPQKGKALEYQSQAALWLTVKVFGHPPAEGRSTPSTGNPVSREERRSEHRLSDAEIWVAHEAAKDVFAAPRVLEIGREMFMKTMDQLMPSAHAMTRSEKRVSVEKLLTDPTKLESGRQQVSVIFGAIPQKEDSVLKRLVEVMAKSKLQFQVVVPGALPADLEQFHGALIRKVQETRGIQGGVDVKVVSEETAITGFAKQNSENALVYDLREDNGEALRVLEPAVSISNQGKRMLFVFSDKGMTLTQKSYGLIAAINTLLEQKPEEQNRLHGVQSLSVIFKLAENLQKFAEAARSLASAA